jgi:predicted acylesterase/phospholipase RssA
MRLAVVLEGGGAKGAYQVGVLKVLDEAPDVEIVAVSGASIGALNAAFFSRGDLQQLESLWRGIRRRDVLRLSRSVAVTPFAAFLVGLVFAANVAAWNIHIVLTLIAAYRYARSRTSGPDALTYILFGLVAGTFFHSTKLPLHFDERIIRWSAKFPKRVSVMSSKPLRRLIENKLPPAADARGISTYVSTAEYGPFFDPDNPGFRWWRLFGEDYFYVFDPGGLILLRPRYVEISKLPEPEVVDLLLQSAALPVLLPAGPSGLGFVSTDGGAIDNAPIAPLLDVDDAERILVVHLGHKMSRIIAARRRLRAKYRFYKLDSMDPKELHRRWLGWAADEAHPSPWRGEARIRVGDMPPGPPRPSLVPEADITEPFASIHHLQPKRSIGNLFTGTLNFSGWKIEQLIELGESDTRKLLEAIRTSPPRPHTARDLDNIPNFTGAVDRGIYIVRWLLRRFLFPRWYRPYSR